MSGAAAGSARLRRRWMGPPFAARMAAAVLSVTWGVGPAGSEAGAQVGDREQTLTSEMNLQANFVAHGNAQLWDELGALFEEDALDIPFNHEPIRGRAAAAEYFRGMRDGAREVTGASERRGT